MKISTNCKHFYTVKALWQDSEPGGFFVDDDGTFLWLRVPVPNDPKVESVPLRIPLVERLAEDGQVWSWDGDTENPTLEPSIDASEDLGFHGWLKNGKLTWTEKP